MKVVISCHFDTVFRDPYARIMGNGILLGACDNIAGLLAVAQLISDPDIYIEFTEDEEMHMDGARYVAKKFDPNDTFIIVVDVTVRAKNWDKVNFTVENWSGIQIKDIKKVLPPTKGFRYRTNQNGTESEAWLYKELGFAVIEIDIPVSDGLHSLDGKARIEDILRAANAIEAIAAYVKNKTREQLSDYIKPT